MIRIVGLTGKSATGKTSVAKELARRLGIEVRHCGELVKNRARQLGVPTDELPANEHAAIDSETRSIAENALSLIVIEGRFLKRVLKGTKNVRLFELICTEKTRTNRSRSRMSGIPLSLTEVQRTRDEVKSSKDIFTVSTESLTVFQVASEIINYIEGNKE